ncbi:hypothetical protein DOTSEDRAFT_56677 [Dothistroma septosporum NZE10]|uniref:F-box domain-containing protein n=1 Tax=Dothistroma septosporum (strain NZE10 / CBS 128990) TaxID=675120 RepID=M2YK09_DOTSN|nr:hypothetical protein DOTSEDRAFT_56677 [Dothistroma septosporum NZE10]
MPTHTNPTLPREHLLDLTYARPNITNHTLDEHSLDQKCPLDIGSHRVKPVFDLGWLERLPYELVAEILAELDLRSLFDFCAVNQRAMQAADGVPQFKQILKHNTTALRAMLAIQVGSYTSCTDLLRTLKTANCEHCGDFAGYIYLLHCTRVCFLCFTEEMRYLPLTAPQLYRDFGISKISLPGLPFMKSLPGRYSPNGTMCPKSLTLYDRDSAKKAGIAAHGSQAVMEQFVTGNFSRKMDEFENRERKYINGPPAPKPRRPISALEEHDGRSSNPRRFMSIVNAPVQLLQASVDQDSDSHFRLLLNKKHIKYITIAAGVYEDDDMCFAPSLSSILPPFPTGDWNDGYIAKNEESGQPYFRSAGRTAFPRVRSVWHSNTFDYLDLTMRTKLRTNLYEVRTSGSSDTMVAKFARFDWEIGYLDNECAAYRWIEDTGVGPRFLGNIAEEGRAIGFVLEHLPDAHHATPADYAACKEALSKLHHMGIAHGDINKYNFLVVNGKATLIDFDCARKTTDK